MELKDRDQIDRQLVEKALRNDSEAFEQLFRRYKKDLLRFCTQWTGNNLSDAGDILQETFIKVYLNLNKYNPEYTFRQWIHTIARNAFIDYTRKRKEGHLSIDSPNWAAPHLNPAANTANPEERMMQDQTGKELDKALDRMSPRYKTMITMRFIQEYSYEEIAEKLDMPLGTVKTQIHRAREQFFRIISNNDSIL